MGDPIRARMAGTPFLPNKSVELNHLIDFTGARLLGNPTGSLGSASLVPLGDGLAFASGALQAQHLIAALGSSPVPLTKMLSGDGTVFSALSFSPFKDYDPNLDTGTSDHVSLNAMLAAAHSLSGGTCVVPRGHYLLDEQLVTYDDVALILQPGAWLWRNWTSATSDWQDATIINEHCPAHGNYIVNPGPYTQVNRNRDISIVAVGAAGFRVTARATTEAEMLGRFSGPHISLHFCDRPEIRNVTFYPGARQVCVSLNATDIAFTGNRMLAGDAVFEVGLWYFGGGGGFIGGNIFITGEDCLAGGGPYNVAHTGCAVGPNWYYSEKGHALHLVQVRNGVTAGFAPPTEYVENWNLMGGAGLPGQTHNAAIRIAAWPSPDKVRAVRWDGFLFDHSNNQSHDQVNPYGALIDGGYDIALKGKLLSPETEAALVTGGADRILLDFDAGMPSQAAQPVYRIEQSGEVEIRGRGMCGTIAGVVATDVGLLKLAAFEIDDVPTGAAAVSLNGATTCAFDGLTARRAAMATNTRVFALNSTSASVRGEGLDAAGVDFVRSFGATPPSSYRVLGQTGPVTTHTIFNGAISYQGAARMRVLCEGGVSDTLSLISGGLDGDEFELVSDEANPAAVVLRLDHGIGAGLIDFTINNAGADYLLDSKSKGVTLRFQDGQWRCKQKW